eukprot:TRINITY_DN11663_c0_g1_i1.p1 TRINITY_DN11663_c0_g1~~TRINITY_DN11663_c0_g1_i1.p1  ORF type:complete len:1083 (+),score=216.91 TRINITY_DN11663_c0_g1_i1:65-3313(+)
MHAKAALRGPLAVQPTLLSSVVRSCHAAPIRLVSRPGIARGSHDKPGRICQPRLLRGSQWSGLRFLASRPMMSCPIARNFSSMRTQAVLAAPPPAPRVGANSDVVKELGFVKLEEQFIDEYKCTAVLYRHTKTGAEVMSVTTDDENKVFGIVFRTPPKDSTGIPHILEHSVLCGSRKYPLKEPFVELLKGSLHTFLNAFTYPDRTCYPVASTNLKDFYNLVDVYLDAVFFPKCVNEAQTFQQEGWHYELNDPSEDITFKGVVFNEMKGVYSQPESVLGRVTQQELFPDNTYNVDSGGDPVVIPNLTFEEFQNFHKTFYHPSNSRIWIYGDDDPDERLRIISGYLDQFEANSSAKESEVAVQRLFTEPKRIVQKYAVGDAGDINKKYMVSLNWLLSDTDLDLQTELALGFLDHLMLGSPASPLKRALLESGLGEAMIGGGVEDELRQPSFSIGLKGVAKEDIEKVEELITMTLKKLAAEGFTDAAVEASINSIEFSLRENNTGSFPRGLSLMLRSMGKWLYGGDPFEPLRFAKPLEEFKTRLAAEGSTGVFSPLIQKYLLDNNHRVAIVLEPDLQKAAQDEAAEQEKLTKFKAQLQQQELQELVRSTEELRLKQETPDPPEALKAVPCLSLDDIPKEPVKIPIAVDHLKEATILRHDLFTNDVLYAEIGFDLRTVKPDLLPLVPLFCQSLLEMGTKDLTFVQLNQLINQKTGGISVYPSTSAAHGRSEPASHLFIRGKAVAARSADLFELMRTVLQDVQFTDQQRFKQFVLTSRSRMESRLIGGGHGIAAARMDAMMNVAGWVSEQMGGLSYLEFLRELVKQVDDDWPTVAASLESIRTSLLSRKGAIVNLTADEKILTSSEQYVSQFLDALPESRPEPLLWNKLVNPKNEGFAIPTQVNYVGKAANIYEAGYKLSGSALVISKHIGNTWLWDRVRVSGGAYGGFCDFDTHSGVFSYLSYRDPNLLKTVDIYDGTVDFLRELELDQDALTKAIIGTIGDMDSYQLPDAKGYSSLVRYLLGVTEEERRQRRQQVLSTSIKDFHEFADALASVRDRGVVVAVASAEDLGAANEERPGFFDVQKVL